MRKPCLCIKRNKSEKHPWRIEGYRENGKRKRLFFRSRQEADLMLARLQHVKAREGEEASRLDITQRGDAIRALAILAPLGASLEIAARFYAERMAVLSRSRSVNDVASEMIESKRKDGASKQHLHAMRISTGRFSRCFGERLIAEISSLELDDWLRSLPVGGESRNFHRRYLSLLFGFAKLRGYCEDNPVERTSKAKVVSSPPAIFTPDEARIILESAPRAVLAFFAIGLFAGIRVEEIKRLDWRHVNLSRRFIEITAANAKTSSRRLVRIEDNLAAWLAPLVELRGAICGANFRKVFDAARKASGVDWKKNAMRHSFASYHLARGQNAAATALQLGHPNTNMLFAHYREIVTSEEAERYFSIMPSGEHALNIIPMSA